MYKNTEGRQSTVSFKLETSVIIDPIPELTQGRVFPTLLLIMEAAYVFAVSSMMVYTLYGLGEFMVSLSDREILDMTTEARFYGTCVVLLVGILCDSYFGHYYSTLTLLCANIVLPVLYFTIAVYPYTYKSTVKVNLVKASNPFWAVLLCTEPLRIAVIASAVFEKIYFRKPRAFFALLVYVWNIGITLAGLTVYLCGSSRIGYTIISGVDVACMVLYVIFWILSRRTLLIERSPWAVVERAVSYTLCLWMRKIDKWFLRKCVFKRSQGQNDFRFVRFSDRSASNSRSLSGILLVVIPLTAYFSMLVILETLYIVQIAMLKFSKELFPLVAVKSGIYLLLFPPMEFVTSKFLPKWFRNVITQQLALIGVGAFIVSFAVMWTSVVQHEIVKDMDFWTHRSDVAHLSITNCLGVPVNIRGEYYNLIVSKAMDQWTTLEPLRPLFVLKIPEYHLPFHLEFENNNISLYDEYTLGLSVGSSQWYILFREGIQQVHPSCYSSESPLSMNPKMLQPATVCVMCALSVCNGHLKFKGNSVKEQISVPLGEPMEDSKIHISGRYLVTVRFGDLDVSGEPVEFNFERLGSYLIIVYESKPNKTTKKSHQNNTVSFERSSALHALETFPPRKLSVWWILPTVFLHAIGQVLAEASLLTYLYLVSAAELRTTVFSLTRFLSLPTYWYLCSYSSLILQGWRPIYYFSLGCANCLFMIIYFFSTVYYVHLFLAKPAPIRHRRSLARTSSDMAVRAAEDEISPRIKEN